MKARNSDGTETDFSGTSTFYTLQATPTAATIDTATTTVLTITASGSFSNLVTGTAGLYFENVTEGTNSGWVQTNSWEETGLTTNTGYAYRVKARNSEGTETAFTGTSTLYTIQATPIAVTAVEADVDTLSVTAAGSFANLTTGTAGLYFENVTEGTNSGWVQINSWTETGLENNTDYTYRAKSRNSEGTETAFSGSSILTTDLLIARSSLHPAPWLASPIIEVEVPEVPIEVIEEVELVEDLETITPHEVSNFTLVKTAGDSAVYQINEDGTRSPFISEDHFFSRYTSFDEIDIISDEEMSGFALGAPVPFESGSLVKFQTVSKVYLVEENNVLTWISSELIFLSLGYNFNMVNVLFDSLWPLYTINENVIE